MIVMSILNQETYSNIPSPLTEECVGEGVLILE